MLKQHSPATVAPPFSRYSHGVEAQIEQAWRNMLSVLAAAGMGPRNLVKVTTFLINRADLPTARAVRDRMLQGAEPASTLVFVAGLASPEWQVEIEAIAAAA